MKKKHSLNRLVEISIIAAIYTALTLAIPGLSYGLLQIRVSEVLTILPVFTPSAIPGLAIGCAISNFVGIAANPAGAWDILFGSLTTLIAAVLTRLFSSVKINSLPVLSTLPPVILNAIVIGLELTMVIYGFSWTIYFVSMIQVAIGQLLSCTVGGLVLYSSLTRSGAANKIFN